MALAAEHRVVWPAGVLVGLIRHIAATSTRQDHRKLGIPEWHPWIPHRVGCALYEIVPGAQMAEIQKNPQSLTITPGSAKVRARFLRERRAALGEQRALACGQCARSVSPPMRLTRSKLVRGKASAYNDTARPRTQLRCPTRSEHLGEPSDGTPTSASKLGPTIRSIGHHCSLLCDVIA